MKKTASFLDDFLKISAASTLLLIIAGFVELKSYYSKFGIVINDYISTSEILLFSLDRLLLVIFSLLIQMIFWYLIFNDIVDYDLSDSINDGEKRPKKFDDETINRFRKNKKVKIFWIILLSGTVITLIFSLLHPGNTVLIFVKELFFVNLCITIFVYPLWLVPTRKIWEILKTNKDYNSKVILTIIVFFSASVMTLWFKNNYFEFNRIRKYGNDTFVEIILNDKSKVSPTDTIRYIGRTEKYFFYWDKISKVTTVFPSNEVSKIIVK